MNKKGQTLIEYALILIIIAVAVIAAMFLLRSQINTLFNRISTLTPLAPVSSTPLSSTLSTESSDKDSSPSAEKAPERQARPLRARPLNKD